MIIQAKSWQANLRTWLQTHSKTISDDLRQLRENFVQKFPPEDLQDLTLERYAVGMPDSFCLWLEFKTKALGSISGGTAAKFGVWWSKSEGHWRWNSVYDDENDALAHLKAGFVALIDAARAQQFDVLDKIGKTLLGPNRYSLRSKPLYLYFPEYFLPISSIEHLKYFLEQFGKKSEGDLIVLNRHLLALLRSLPEFDGFDTTQMMMFLYDTMSPAKAGEMPIEALPPDQSDGAVPIPPISNRTSVFISYSHEDKDDLDRLLVHLKSAKHAKQHNHNKVEWWDDTQIKPGANWNDEIKKAMASARIAVLLVSVDYLASEFILKNELPTLLAASEAEGVTILPVILGPCIFQYTNLAPFQAVNSPSNPLSKMDKHGKNDVWNKVIMTILHADADPDKA